MVGKSFGSPSGLVSAILYIVFLNPIELLLSYTKAIYSETCLKQPLKNRQNKGLKAMW